MRPLLVSAVALSFTAVASAQQITDIYYVDICVSGSPDSCVNAVQSFVAGGQGRIERSRYAQVAIENLTHSVCQRSNIDLTAEMCEVPNINIASVTKGITYALTVPSRARAIRAVKIAANACAQLRHALSETRDQVDTALGGQLVALRPSPN